MKWWLYNVLFAVVYVAMLPRFLMRMARRGGYREGFLQRFGCYSAAVRARLAARPHVWIHAVSVGEMFVALRLLEDLRPRLAGTGFVVTTTTSTGHRIAAERLAAEDVLLYVPVDFPGVVRRVLGLIRPRTLLLTESELWPNLIRQSHGAGVPVVLVNGRISPSSFSGYRRLRWFVRDILRMMTRLLVQTEGDRARLEELGADPGRLMVTGTAKYDMGIGAAGIPPGPRAWLNALGVTPEMPVLMGGSTWAGEEAALLQVFQALRAEHPGLRLVLAPRHAERGDEVEQLIQQSGFSLARRSGKGGGAAAGGVADVMLADSTGELMGFYACATVVFVGKSLTNTGGQNFIEPAMLGKAVLTGPHLENFPAVAEDFLVAGALRQVRDVAELEGAVRELLADAAAREAMGQRAQELVAARRGSVARMVDAIVQEIELRT